MDPSVVEIFFYHLTQLNAFSTIIYWHHTLENARKNGEITPISSPSFSPYSPFPPSPSNGNTLFTQMYYHGYINAARHMGETRLKEALDHLMEHTPPINNVSLHYLVLDSLGKLQR